MTVLIIYEKDEVLINECDLPAFAVRPIQRDIHPVPQRVLQQRECQFTRGNQPAEQEDRKPLQLVRYRRTGSLSNWSGTGGQAASPTGQVQEDRQPLQMVVTSGQAMFPAAGPGRQQFQIVMYKGPGRIQIIRGISPIWLVRVQWAQPPRQPSVGQVQEYSTAFHSNADIKWV
jgi:hypothetical protein